MFPDLLVLEGRKKLGLKSGSIESISMARRTHFCEDLISEQDALNDKNVAETLDGCFRRDAPVNIVPQENPHESPHLISYILKLRWCLSVCPSVCPSRCRSWFQDLDGRTGPGLEINVCLSVLQGRV